MAGSHHNDAGGGTTRLCMPNNPDYTLPFINGVQKYSPLFPVEYQYTVQSHGHDIPCAVCVVPTKDLVLMVPGKSRVPLVQLDSRESTMATSCQRGCIPVISDLHSNALTKISSLCMEVQNIRYMVCLVMSRLCVMHYPALLTTITKRSTVLCAQCSCSELNERTLNYSS